MRFHILTVLVAFTASTLGNTLLPRGACSSLKSKKTVVGGATVTLTGPFKVKASASGSSLSGNYVFAQPGGKVIYDLQSSSGATDLYLEKNGHLVLVDGKTMYTAYEKDPSDFSGVLIMGTSKASNLVCDIDKSNCELKCTVSGGSYQCLASPLDKPDWRVAKSKSDAAQNCVPFTPVIVPA